MAEHTEVLNLSIVQMRFHLNIRVRMEQKILQKILRFLLILGKAHLRLKRK